MNYENKILIEIQAAMQHSPISVAPDQVLVGDNDPDFEYSQLFRFYHEPFDTESGVVEPKDQHLQFDLDRETGEVKLITGECTEWDVSACHIFMALYWAVVCDCYTKEEA